MVKKYDDMLAVFI